MQELSQIVVFKLDNESFGISITQVKEIIKTVEAFKLPQTPPYFEGIVNLRSEVHAIFNLRTKFGLEKKGKDDNAKIVVLNEKNIGFIVDEVSEIFRVEKEDMDTITDLPGSIKKQYISGIVKKHKNIIVILDLNRILSEEDEAGLNDMENRL